MGDLLRHPEIAAARGRGEPRILPHAARADRQIGRTVDLRDIEWIAGGLIFRIEPPNGPGTQQSFHVRRRPDRGPRGAGRRSGKQITLAGRARLDRWRRSRGEATSSSRCLPALGPAPIYVPLPERSDDGLSGRREGGERTPRSRRNSSRGSSTTRRNRARGRRRGGRSTAG